MIANAKRGSRQIVFGKDSVVVQKFISGIPGGRTLNVADFPLSVIPAGHVIIEKEGVYYPMPVTATTVDGETTYAYAELPEGATYVGINYRTIAKENPQSSILYDGVVNPECMFVSIESIQSAFAAAVPHIIFQKDEDAGTEYNA